MPHLSRAGHGNGFAAGPHLSNAAGGRGQACAGELLRHPHRSLPRMPELPDCLSLRRAIRKLAGAQRARRSRRTIRRPWLARKLREHFYGRCCRRSASWRDRRKLVRFYQRSGLQPWRAKRVAEAFGSRRLTLCRRASKATFPFAIWARRILPKDVPRGRVALLIGCVSSVAFAELNRATIRVLNKNGIEVCCPRSKVVAARLHAHAGLLEAARTQARRTSTRCSARNSTRL